MIILSSGKSNRKYDNNANSVPNELILRTERIIAENETPNLLGDDFFTFEHEKDEKLQKDDSPYLKVYNDINELNKLSVSSTKLWRNLIQNMKEDYDKRTNKMDDKWKNFMWNMIWEKHYLQNVHRLINKALQDLNNPVTKKEEIINQWFQWTEEGLEIYLKCINDLWNNVVSNKLAKNMNNQQAISDITEVLKKQLHSKENENET
ncbi:Plasmodium exported protein, unknown function [Plasmodium gonderi]|uniref:Plasmodium RESA N-terminal domain-containing protein n=1 Tax=Plasmodium gonderi TaxID=77519 RepID=A0A1Y1JGB0_PLAGO|nr:Plasmodium exported protein, unknown function [Plasmodium gonderi]GAW81559.1 Plasmodium exported protein, unknown function [Plasmodium gonderi]